MPSLYDIFGYQRITDGVAGVEIEVEGRRLPAIADPFWNVTKDGSLKAEEAYEYVTKDAYSLENLRTAFNTLETIFDKRGSEVFKSDRTSTHIHVNVQKEDFLSIVGILFAWSMVERVWMTLCGENRSGNLYCLPMSTCGFTADYAAKYLRYHRDGRYDKIYGMGGKYGALNIDPIYKQGSVEFRTFPCSMNSDQLMFWVKWCTNLVKYGIGIDRDNLSKEWQKVHDDPMTFLSAIFGESHKELPEAFLRDAIQQGCMNAADITLIWADHVLQEAKKGFKEKAGYPWQPKPGRARLGNVRRGGAINLDELVNAMPLQEEIEF